MILFHLGTHQTSGKLQSQSHFMGAFCLMCTITFLWLFYTVFVFLEVNADVPEIFDGYLIST